MAALAAAVPAALGAGFAFAVAFDVGLARSRAPGPAATTAFLLFFLTFVAMCQLP